MGDIDYPRVKSPHTNPEHHLEEVLDKDLEEYGKFRKGKLLIYNGEVQSCDRIYHTTDGVVLRFIPYLKEIPKLQKPLVRFANDCHWDPALDIMQETSLRYVREHALQYINDDYWGKIARSHLEGGGD